jgi:hypothetical protein
MKTKTFLPALIAAATLFASAAQATPISATFSGTLLAEPVDEYTAMYYGTPDFRFDGASYEITIHGDTDTASNFNSSWRGSSQKYDFTRFDVFVDLSITSATDSVNVTGLGAQISFYNFLNESPWGDIISLSVNPSTSGGDNVSAGLQQVDQSASSIIWDTDGSITSLSALTEPGFDPNGVLRGFLRDSNDANASYLTAPLTSGSAAVASASVSTVPLPAPALLLLGSIGGLASLRRKRKTT